jgi:gentisate 1,2-dioxygenase
MATLFDTTDTAGDHTAQALYYDPANAFDFRWPPVPRRQFLAECEQAFAGATPTGLVPLDASDALETPYPATTPSLLAQYLRLRGGESFTTRQRASGEVYFVIRGAGQSDHGGDRVAWHQGDLFCFPGGQETVHSAADEDAILFCVSDEPLVLFQGLQPSAAGETLVETVHWPAAEIDKRLDTVYARENSSEEAGRAVLFSSQALAPARNILPMMVAAINTLEPGRDQRPHRHNGVAITLALEGEGVYSLIENERVDWVTGAAQVTPATELHSHHNRGTQRMRSLVIQDEGLHYYTRTPGFSWD